jgi:hypothetical protein
VISRNLLVVGLIDQLLEALKLIVSLCYLSRMLRVFDLNILEFLRENLNLVTQLLLQIINYTGVPVVFTPEVHDFRFQLNIAILALHQLLLFIECLIVDLCLEFVKLSDFLFDYLLFSF